MADPCDRTNEKNKRYLDWIAKYKSSVDGIAANLNTNVENILALSAIESGWGTGPFARDGGNNFFSLHAPPGWTGKTRTASGNTSVKLCVFDSYADCAKMFADKYGAIVRGKADGFHFAESLQNAGKFGIMPDGSKVAHFVGDVQGTARNFASRLQCK